MMFALLLLSSLSLFSVQSEVVQPCQLAAYLFDNLGMYGLNVTGHIPFLVCVAGYHNFDTDYTSGNFTTVSVLDKDWNVTYEVRHYDFKGIFGLSKEEYLQLEQGNSSVAHEALFFIEHILNEGLGDGEYNRRYLFYKTLCTGDAVSLQVCDIKAPYLVTVPVPLKLGQNGDFKFRTVNDFVGYGRLDRRETEMNDTQQQINVTASSLNISAGSSASPRGISFGRYPLIIAALLTTCLSC